MLDPKRGRAAAIVGAACVALAAAWTTAARAQTMCTEPLRPLCLDMAAGSIDWTTPEGQRCRQDLETYRETLSEYQGCLADKVKEIQAEARRLDSLLECTAETPGESAPEAARAAE